MSFAEFLEAVRTRRRPEAAAPVLALWQDACGDWDGAHATVQHATAGAGAWVHAYLHRKGGDLANARYWYARAGRPAVDADTTTEAEREAIVRELLE